MWSLSLRAFSYLAMSDMPFHDELALSHTHLVKGEGEGWGQDQAQAQAQA